MALIRKDKHGIYAKFGGYVFRPLFPVGYAPRASENGTTRYSEGEKIAARHHGGSPLGKVGEETWFIHGAYMGPDGNKTSEECFKPSYEKWD